MCIIYSFYNVNEELLSKYKDSMKSNYYSNNDGYGYMYAVDNKLVIKRQEVDDIHKESFDSFYDKLLELVSWYNGNLVIHMRLSTSGDKSNIHPFKISGRLGFVHNGVLDEEKIGHSPYLSDTYILCEIFKQFKFNIFKSNKMEIEMLSKLCNGNKLVFMNNKGEIKYINESLGYWKEDKVWVSKDIYVSNKKSNNIYDLCNSKKDVEFLDKYYI